MVPVFVTIFMINHVKGISNSGTEFVLGFPEFSSWKPNTDEIQLVMSTAHSSGANINITFLQDSKYISFSFLLSSSKSEIVPIPLGVRVEGSGLSRKGIVILATNPITVMGLSRGSYSAASFLALPIDALGVDYYVVTWERDMSAIEFLIIGVYDNTHVQWTFPTSISLTGYFAERGNPFTETISRLDTLQIQAMEDLSGTRVKANKKITVISGNAKAVVQSGGYWDHLLEMLPSVDKWGKHFTVTSTPLTNWPDCIKLVSGFHNTNFSMNCGSIESFILATPGAVHIQALYNGYSCELISDKPILVVLFTNNQIYKSGTSDPSMVLIPPVEQWSNAYTFSVADDTIFDNYLILILRNVDHSALLLNGNTVNTHGFKKVQNTDFYSGFRSISKGVYTLTHESGNTTFSALLYGKERYIAYYVPVGMNQNSLYQMSTTTAAPPVITTALTHVTNEFTAEKQTTEIPTARPGSTETSAKLTFEAETNNPSTVSSGDNTYSGHVTEETVHVDTSESSTSFSRTDETDSTLDNSTCGCCLNYSISNEDLEAKLKELRLKLLVPKKSTALYKRSLISVMDSRPSAIITGSTLGVLVLVVLASVIILMDIIKFCCKK